jgi:hypothetical protein
MSRYLALVALAACTATPAADSVVDADPQEDALEPVATQQIALPRPQPAGIYFRLTNYRACESFPEELSAAQCATPTHALIAGVYDDIRQVRRAWKAVQGLRLASGYPVVAHTTQLGIDGADDGIVVVLGLFVDAGSAGLWKAALDAKMSTRVVALLDNETALERTPSEAPFATRVRPGVSANAFRGALGEVFSPDEEPRELPPAEGAPRQLVCTLEGGSPVFADGARMNVGSYYEWMPVTCPDGQRAWIDWKTTMANATIFRVGDHEELFQVVGAHCDSPEWSRFPWREERAGEDILADAGPSARGC